VRKALIVGIDYYDHVSQLNGCVADARSVRSALERHADAQRMVNFAAPAMLLGTGRTNPVIRSQLRDAIKELFAGKHDIALFYFAGHGHIDETGGYLCTSEVRSGDDGLALSEIMTLANNSQATNRVIILDSCHSGIAASRPDVKSVAEIREGMTVLTASTDEQDAMESGGSGLFTNLLVDALNGAAANLVGDITPGSVYAHIDQSLGPWAQRPVFKTNVTSFVSLRQSVPPIDPSALRQLSTLFPRPDHVFELDPSYEPERSAEQRDDPSIPPPDPEKTAVFSILQKYVRVNLAVPVGAQHMWHAAMQSKACALTDLGRHYRQLIAKGLI
jgi:hypothetical protein